MFFFWRVLCNYIMPPNLQPKKDNWSVIIIIFKRIGLLLLKGNKIILFVFLHPKKNWSLNRSFILYAFACPWHLFTWKSVFFFHINLLYKFCYLEYKEELINKILFHELIMWCSNIPHGLDPCAISSRDFLKQTSGKCLLFFHWFSNFKKNY